MKRAFLTTTGTCCPSVTDFRLIKAYLRNNGWILSKNKKDSTIIIIYTCAFTKEREDLSVECIQKAQKEKNANAQIIVTGCLPVINKNRLKQIFKESVVNADSLEGLDKLLNPRLSIRKINYTGSSLKFKHNTDLQYLLRIGWGCSGKCSYCAVKFVFGKPRSRPLLEIIQEFQIAYSKGYRRFVLVANDSGNYGKDLNLSLISLLNRLSAKHGECRFALSHLSPDVLKKIFPRLKKFIDSGKIYRINMPVESGSQRILRLMNRNYTINDFKVYVQKLIACNQNLIINTDILLGFPSETKQDFRDTLKLVEWLGRNRVFFQCLAYSPRPNTKASKLPGQIDQKAKTMRLTRINKLCGFSYILRDKKLFKNLKRRISKPR